MGKGSQRKKRRAREAAAGTRLDPSAIRADETAGETTDEATEAEATQEREHGLARKVARKTLSLVLFVTAVLCATVLVRTYVADVFVIPTGSMEPTIMPGNEVLGEKLSLVSGEPEVGDVVTFLAPDRDDGTVYIKRVIATAGQTVELSGGKVIVDGEALDEEYVHGQESDPLEHGPNLDEDVSYPYVVPEGCVWVMGDNRDNSSDSRYFGAVSLDDVTSVAVCVFWPPSDAKSL